MLKITYRSVARALAGAAALALVFGVGSGAASSSLRAGHAGQKQFQPVSVTRLGTTAIKPATTVLPELAPFTASPVERDFPGRGHPSSSSSAYPHIKGLPVVDGSTNHHLQVAPGLNAYDQRFTHGFNVEPGDEGFCTDGNYVLQANNLIIAVFRPDGTPYSSVGTLESFFGNNLAFAANGGDFTIQGDPQCLYDQDTQRWFVTQLYLDLSTSTSAIQIAVSKTPDPNLGWNLYSIDTTNAAAGETDCPCYGDAPKIGASRDALYISTNEFSINGPEFYGSQIYLIDKRGLTLGLLAPTSLQLDTFAIPTPDGTCTGTSATCWYSVMGTTTSENQFDDRFGGTEYALSSLEFFGTGDNRIELWAFTNLGSLRSLAPSVSYSMATLTTGKYLSPPLAQQKPGPTPLYDVVFANGAPHPGPVDSGFDEMQNAWYANGVVWSGLTTGMVVGKKTSAPVAGAMVLGVRPSWAGTTLGGSVAHTYIGVKGQNVIYPAVAATPTGSALVAFTLVGPKYWPTSAFVAGNVLGATTPVEIANAGMSPQDGFSEYEFWGTSQWRPRWGDYMAAVENNGRIYFSSQYIQYPNCDDSTFAIDPSCGGTRGTQSNWGTSIDSWLAP